VSRGQIEVSWEGPRCALAQYPAKNPDFRATSDEKRRFSLAPSQNPG
jgi:hypothetical protein